MLALVWVFMLFAFTARYWIHTTALTALEGEAETLTGIQSQTLESELTKFRLLPRLLSENPYLVGALASRSAKSIALLNLKLAELVDQTGATYIYAVDVDGTTIASSNYEAEESFVDRNYEFRPYFQDAIRTGWGQHFAKGERTGKAGLFLATRVQNDDQIMGVIVVKVEFEALKASWREAYATSFVTDTDGIILFSSDLGLEFKTTAPLSEDRRSEISNSNQFGTSYLESANITIAKTPFKSQIENRRSLIKSRTIQDLDWTFYRGEDVEHALTTANARVHLIWLFSAALFASFALFIAWRLKQARDNAVYLERLERDVEVRTSELSISKERLEIEIEERARVNAKYRSAREELAQANRLGSIGAITTNVAHEVNQPLAAIRAFAENSKKFLARGNTEKTQENLGSIVDLTDRLSAITSELRLYSKRGSGEIGVVDLSDVIDGINLLIGDKIRSSNVQFDILVVEATNLRVKAGRVRLEQVFVNLLQNALDAVEGQTEPKIEIRIEETASKVSIIIEDNGTGIKDEVIGEIFDPFVTTKEDGLGIGLGIAQGIMSEFGGSLELIKGQRLGGAAFLLCLVKS